MIFRSINRNLANLEIEVRNYVEDSNDRSLRNTAAEKDKMFRSFKVIMLSYLFMVMTVSLVNILFLTNYPWIALMLQELLELLMFGCIAYVIPCDTCSDFIIDGHLDYEVSIFTTVFAQKTTLQQLCEGHHPKWKWGLFNVEKPLQEHHSKNENTELKSIDFRTPLLSNLQEKSSTACVHIGL